MYFANIADLLAQLGPISSTTEFNVGGFYKRGDGGGGTFIWVPVPAGLPEDLGIIFYSPNDLGGYFQRIFSGPVNVRWFGAIIGATDPTPPPGYPSTIYDVTPYVHRARNSQEFANNGTLYFPRGTYPGAFEFTSNPPTYTKNEFNILGDGQGTILQSNGQIDPNTGQGYPVLTVGFKAPTWRWAKVANLQINGANKRSDGVRYYNPGGTELAINAGRWVFEQVLFIKCDKAVHKPFGNIGNNYIDCSWRENNYGIYAIGYVNTIERLGMHAGCDRYSGGEFSGHAIGCIYYEDIGGGAGQIILDGTVIEGNAGWGIHAKFTQAARMLQCAISIRNVYFEHNAGGDMEFEGARSVRIDDCMIWKLKLIASSVNLYNCVHMTGGYPNDWIKVDSNSSLVAYEQRYRLYPNCNIFINSISYDGTPELGYQDSAPAPWVGTSVWGPLRAVTSKSPHTVTLSDHLDSAPMVWDDYSTNQFYAVSDVSAPRVLGDGSNKVIMGAHEHIWSKDVIGYAKGGKYTVWSIHAYTEDTVEDGEFYGQIIAEGEYIFLGHVYFRQNQWACSYGMKWVLEDCTIRLAFKTTNAAKTFYITDYQVVHFDDLASANSFVNSREFVTYKQDK